MRVLLAITMGYVMFSMSGGNIALAIFMVFMIMTAEE